MGLWICGSVEMGLWILVECGNVEMGVSVLLCFRFKNALIPLRMRSYCTRKLHALHSIYSVVIYQKCDIKFLYKILVYFPMVPS
jgi:hypothetical protein